MLSIWEVDATIEIEQLHTPNLKTDARRVLMNGKVNGVVHIT